MRSTSVTKTLAGWCFVLAAGLVVWSTGGDALAQDKGPIKVGLLVSYTGIAPLQAKGVTDGVELAFAEAGNMAGGSEIKVFKEDTEFNPTVALTKVKRLIEEQEVNFVVGPISSAVVMAMHDYVSKAKAVTIVPTAFTKAATSPQNARPNIFRTVETTDQGNFPMGKWMIENTPHRQVVVAGMDYSAGHDSVNAFKAGFEAAGGKVIKEVFTPIGTMDMASFVASMDVKGADAIYVFYAGTDGIRFVQQYAEYGLKERIPLYGYTSIADDPYLDSIGDAVIGVVSSTVYNASIDTPANKAFVEAYQKRYGERPSHYSEYGYVAGKMIVAAAEALGGDVSDPAKVSAAIKAIAGNITTPSGPLAFDEYNQRIVNGYVQRAEKIDGKLTNVIVDKLGAVAQKDVWQWWQK